MNMNSGIAYAQRAIAMCLIITTQGEKEYIECSKWKCDFPISANMSKIKRSPVDYSILVHDVEFSYEQFVEVKYVLVNGTKQAIQPYTQVCCDNYHCDEFCHLREDEMESTFGLKVKCVSKTILDINAYISMLCIIIIIFVYSWLPQLRNLHGKCLVCYMIVLGCNNVIAVSVEKVTRIIGKDAFSILTIILASCMIQWIHVITFDTWRKMKSFRNMLCHDGKLHEGKRFLFYALYVCLTPILLLGITRLKVMQEITLFESKKAAFYIIIAYFIILSVINVIFFLLTIRNIHHTKENPILRQDRQLLDKFTRAKNCFVLYFRIFIITGLVTDFVLLSKFLIENYIMSHVLDIFLSLEPIFLFISLILKRSTITIILARWNGTAIAKFHKSVTSASSSTKTGSSDV